MKLINIIYDLKEKLKINSDDMDFTNEYFAHLINVKREYFLKQRFSKFTRNIPEEVKQAICLELEIVDKVDGYQCSGKLLKSKDKLPSLMEMGGRSAIVAIRTKDITFPHLNIVPTERLPYVGHNKFLQSQIYVALDSDNRLYFKSNSPHYLNLEEVVVLGVFSDVELADEMSCDSSSENCDFLEKEYPIEGYLISDIVNSIYNELSPGLQLPNDNTNNSDESNRN